MNGRMENTVGFVCRTHQLIEAFVVQESMCVGFLRSGKPLRSPTFLKYR